MNTGGTLAAYGYQGMPGMYGGIQGVSPYGGMYNGMHGTPFASGYGSGYYFPQE